MCTKVKSTNLFASDDDRKDGQVIDTILHINMLRSNIEQSLVA